MTRSHFLLVEIFLVFFSIPNLLVIIIQIEVCLIFSLQTLLVIIRMEIFFSFPKFKKYYLLGFLTKKDIVLIYFTIE